MIPNYAERLREELAKVPEGCPYINAPNFLALRALLREGTPYYPIPPAKEAQ
jgi:hypothetical protein